MQKRKALPILGRLTKKVRNIDKEEGKNAEILKKSARNKLKENEESGISNVASLFQHWIAPNLSELIGQRIERVFEFTLNNSNNNNNTANQWCSGDY